MNGGVTAYKYTIFQFSRQFRPISLAFVCASCFGSTNERHYAIVIYSISVGPSSAAAPKYAASSQSLLGDLTAETAYNKQNQYFDSTNMAYVLELSNRKSNQNTNVDDDDNNSNIRNSNLRVLPNYNNGQAHNHVNTGANHKANNHENEADDDDNNSVKKTSNTHDSDNKNYFNHYQFNNGDDLEHGGSGSGSGGGNPLNRGPFFDVSASKNVTALVGKMANLNCRIKNLQNKTVGTTNTNSKHITIMYLR